jgi:hypothetical protein
MPSRLQEMFKSLTQKGGAFRPIKSSTKDMLDVGGKRKIQKVKEKFYKIGNQDVSVIKTKGEDEFGNKYKRKEVSKSYYNPLNDENVTVEKVKEGGVKTKEVHRDKENEGSEKEGGKKIAKAGIKAMTEKLKKKKEEEEE